MVVFITRDLSEDSFFKKKLEAHGCRVLGQSLVEIKGKPFLPEELPPADWLFFYSKNGVKHFYQTLGRAFPAKIAVMGAGTADFFQKETFQIPDFVGNGKPEEVAGHFWPLAKGQRVLFLRAECSERSVQQLMPPEVEVHDWVVYENMPKSNFSCPPAEVLVFTSPLNAKAYFEQYALNGQQIVAIGASTAQYLLSLGLDGCLVADQPTEEAMADAVLKIRS